ncbi:MAG: carboxy terminal-processing peptidase [Elusimicrobiota bacterium]|nr:carboxy terminal-processing peptidase [Elusimicrobiota bacterium]
MNRTLRLLLVLLLAGAAPASALERYAGGPIVAELVSGILERTHYNRKPIDDEASKTFLKNYLDAFDYNHMILEKSDVDEFQARFGTTLDDRVKGGDVDAAYEIYDRVLKRLEERVELVKKLTAVEHDFSKNESVVLDRHEAAWPKDRAEAEELWRLRIKHEVLLERLARARAEEAKAAAKAKETAKAAEKPGDKAPADPKAPKPDAPRPSAANPDAPKEAITGTTPSAPKKEDKPQTIKEVVDTRYERLLRSYKEYEGVDVIQTFLNALTQVIDPHTDYLAAAQKENFDISMRLSLVGIGAVLRSEDGYAKIVSLVPGGPADSDKRLKPDDKVEAVAQGDGPFVEVTGMKLDKVVGMIRGEKGTIVRLRVIPASAIDPADRQIIALKREEIKLTDQEAKAKLITVPGASGKNAKVGVIDLPSFYADMQGGADGKSATRDVERLLGELKKRGAESIIIDLRRDGGGSLSEAVSLSGLFIKEGPVVQVKDHRGTIKILRDVDPTAAYDGPLVVLTSRASASAAEIFAAAIQDYKRGLVVGEKSTFGKGTVQSVLELNQYLPPAYRAYKPGALKLTIQKFYRVSGGSTQHKGVLPDIHLPSIGDVAYNTESSYKNALPYDEVEPAPHEPGVTLPVARLAVASAQRVAADREFRWMKQDIERYEKEKKEKEVSLNEKTRVAENKASEERVAARKKERAAQKVKPLESEDISLASLDGKAPAVAKSTASAAPPADAGEDGEFERAPDAPDAVLEECARVAMDLASGSSDPVAERRDSRSVTQ